MKPLVTPNPWQPLRRFTTARIALGRAGDSLPTGALLAFGLAHAQARDAVHQPLDRARIGAQLADAGLPCIPVRSSAPDRVAYLRRPDWGRKLDSASREALFRHAPAGTSCDVAFVLADGLSARAVEAHAVAVLRQVLPKLEGWRVAPVVVAEQARVALGDEIGEVLNANQVVVMIGERPGLSSPDSLGLYLTHSPRVGRTDAERNCISNVRTEGLSYEQAADTLAYLLDAARKLGRSGIELKDESGALPPGSARLADAG